METSSDTLVDAKEEKKETGVIEKNRKRKKNTVPYSTVECLDDLLDLAAEVLVMGGKLVFFVPSSVCGAMSAPTESVESESMAERYLSHPCLERVSFSEDTSYVGRGKSVLRRHLLVLRKIAPWAGPRMQHTLSQTRTKRNIEDRNVEVCVRDIGAKVYKDSRRKVNV
jgi:hypothetical protein